MNKAERVYQLVLRENPWAQITVSDLINICELLPSESPKAIAMRVLDYLEWFPTSKYLSGTNGKMPTNGD